MFVIIGAGLAGLSTAYHLKRGGCSRWVVYEREERPGGLCRSESRGGFTFDYTGHFLHLRDPAMKRLASRWLGPRLREVTRSSWIYSHGVYTRYPFQTNTYGLPVDVVKEILVGYIRARYERVEVPREEREERGPSAAPGDGLAEPRRSFERWVYRNFGPGIARHFMIPYNEKLWGVHPRFLTTEWMGRYVPPASLERVIEGALTDQGPNVGYNATFRYPTSGGIESLVRALAARVGAVKVGLEAAEVDVRRRVVRFSDGSVAEYEALVSTMPLPELLRRIRQLPASVSAAAARLRWSSVFALNLGLRCDLTGGRHWVYVPERKFSFYRVGCFSNASRAMAPAGCSSVWAELSFSARKPLDHRRARQDILAGLKEMGFIRSRKDIAVEWPLEIPYAYVTYDANHRKATTTIHRYLLRHGIHSIGRYGRWEYSSMEDALLAGRATADALLEERHRMARTVK